MTPEERDRLVKVETKLERLENVLLNIDGKLDELRTAASMGKGAWWLILRLGVVLAAFATLAGWFFDRFHK